MALFRRSAARLEKLQEKIEEEIRERVIRREGELREEKEKRLWEQSNIEALQEITDFVSDSEVKRIVEEATKELEGKGAFEEQERSIEEEIQKRVIEREKEIGLEKERALREKGQVEALKEVTDFVTDTEIDRIAREVRKELAPKRQKKRPSKKKPKSGRKGSKKSEESEDAPLHSAWERIRARKGRSVLLLSILLGVVSLSSTPRALEYWILATLPLAVALFFDLFLGKDPWGWLFSFLFLLTIPYIVGYGGLRVLWRDTFAWPDLEASSALIGPILEGEDQVVVGLVEAGSKLNVKNRSGTTPLMAAAEGGRLALVKFLVENGANLNPEDEEGRTALIRAAEREHAQVIRFLIDKGADVRVKDHTGSNALHAALRLGNREMVDLLLGSGLRFDDWVEEENPDLSTDSVVFQALACPRGERTTALVMGMAFTPSSLASFLASPFDDFYLDEAAAEACWCGMEAVYDLLLEKGADHEGCDFGVGQGR